MSRLRQVTRQMLIYLVVLSRGILTVLYHYEGSRQTLIVGGGGGGGIL